MFTNRKLLLVLKILGCFIKFSLNNYKIVSKFSKQFKLILANYLVFLSRYDSLNIKHHGPNDSTVLQKPFMYSDILKSIKYWKKLKNKKCL